MRQLHQDLTQARRSMGYLSVPMSAPTALERTDLRLRALSLSAYLWEAGILHYCPPANSPAIGTTDIPYEDWMAMDLEILRRCDWIFMGHGWEKSPGCQREFNVAMNLGLSVAFNLDHALICGLDGTLPSKLGR